MRFQIVSWGVMKYMYVLVQLPLCQVQTNADQNFDLFLKTALFPKINKGMLCVSHRHWVKKGVLNKGKHPAKN